MKYQSQGTGSCIAVLLLSSYHAHSFLNPNCQVSGQRLTITSSLTFTPHQRYPSSKRLQTPSPTQRLATTPETNQVQEDDEFVGSYRASAWSFGMLSALLLLMPDRTLSKQLATKLGGAGGFGLAAFVFYLLSKSNSYEKGNEYVSFQKRCQLALVGFCSLGLLSFPGEASFWPSSFPAVVTGVIMSVVRTGGLFVALRGWLKGCSDLRWHKELKYGLFDNLRGWKVHDKKKSLFYRNSVLAMYCVMFSNAMGVMFQYRYQDALELSSFAGSLQVSAISRLYLVSSLLFSLKLAAESDSFPSDITWQMNWALAAWAGLVGIGQCVKFHPFFQIAINRVEMLSLSALLFIKGLKVFRQGEVTNNSSDAFDDDSNRDDTPQGDDDMGVGELGNDKD